MSTDTFQPHITAEDIEGDLYLIDIGEGYWRIYDAEHNRLSQPARGLQMRHDWVRFTGDEAAILDKARSATRIRSADPEADALNDRP